MQKIKRKKSNIHPIFNDFDNLYSKLSVREEKEQLFNAYYYDEAFEELFNLFIQLSNHNGVLYTKKKNYAQLEKIDNNNIIVCFSGGKDSIAVVKYYMNAGYNVYLYHMKHINFTLTDEYLQVKKIAEYLNLPLYIDDITLSGTHDYIEHPMKNMIIANGALQYGIRENISTNIAFGNYITSSLQYDNFEYCGGDDIEMWDIYNNIINTVLPDFEVHVILQSLDETLGIICNDKKLLNMSISCLGRANLRKYKHDWVKKKYEIELPTYRCGQCYKCCIEYIYMTDHGLQKYNKDYYKYCFEKLRKNVEAEDRIKYSDIEVWEHYLFYSIEKSRYFNVS